MRKKEPSLQSLMQFQGQIKGDPMNNPKSITLPGMMQIFRNAGLLRSWQIQQTSDVTGDPACPSFAPLDSKEGKWIGPWCDSV